MPASRALEGLWYIGGSRPISALWRGLDSRGDVFLEPDPPDELLSAEPESDIGDRSRRGSLIYCGFCSALNPVGNHFCAACGSTLVDAFYASEGLRVYTRPDPASALIEIIPTGTELEIVEDPAAPADFVRVRLERGRLGYIRLQEVEALAEGVARYDPRAPDINLNARGCVTPGAALAALALLVVSAAFLLVLMIRSNLYDAGVLALLFCVVVLPLMLLTIGLFLYARAREESLVDEGG